MIFYYRSSHSNKHFYGLFIFLGTPLADKLGHGCNPKVLDPSVQNKVPECISSLRARKSHYSLSRPRKLYLPSELNIEKLYEMFRTKYREVVVSYESYRLIFNSEFNISLRYPRTDTCSTCDEFLHRTSDIDRKLKDNNCNVERLLKNRRVLQVEHIAHKKEVETFYQRKREARQKEEKDKSFEDICIDYQRNLPTPNKTTNDVYYKQELTCISFSIHFSIATMKQLLRRALLK